MKQFHSEIDPLSGSREDFYIDPDTGKASIKRSWNVDELCKYANDQHRSAGAYDNYQGDHVAHRVASIDAYTLLNLKRDTGIDVFNLSDPENEKRFFKWLNEHGRHLVTNRKVGAHYRQI